MTQVRVCLMTCADEDSARSLARQLLERRLVACVNLIPGVTSMYWWEGRIQEDAEVLLVGKTDAARLPDLLAAVGDLHSYSVPEVLALPVEVGASEYLRWVSDSVGLSQQNSG